MNIRKVAQRIADAIEADLNQRAHVAICECSPDIQAEIRKTWRRIARRILKEAEA